MVRPGDPPAGWALLTLAAPLYAFRTPTQGLGPGEDLGLEELLGVGIDPAIAPGPGLVRLGSSFPGFGGKRFHLVFLLFVPGCGCLELGFNFPALAASGRCPAGGAKRELSEKAKACWCFCPGREGRDPR